MDKLPKGWKILPFEKVVLNLDSKRIPLKSGDRDIQKGDFPYYGASGIIDYIDKFIFDGEHLLISEDGANLLARTYPIAFIANGRFWVNNHAHIVIAKSDITTNRYLELYFSSINISEYVTGSAQPKLNQSKLNSIPIPLPPLSEQTRIVNKLDSLFERIDKSIALLEENIKHTEALMASGLDEVFGNGDTRIGELCTIGPKKSEIKDLGDLEVSFLPMTDLKEHQINFEPKQTKRISEVYTGYTYFNDNDVLLAKVTPCFENGKAGIAQNLINGIGFGSSEYHVLRANKNTLPEWIYYSVMTATFREEGVNNMTGSSGLKRVPPAFVANWKIKNPPINEQLKIIEKIKSTDAKLSKLITEQQSKLSYLKALKASLLDKAFKGEL